MIRCHQMERLFEEGGTMTSKDNTIDMEQIEEEINICASAIKGAGERINTARVGSMKYFWPFLVVSIPTFIGMWIYSEVNGLFLYCTEGSAAAEDFKTSTILLAVLVFFLIHVFGGAIARHFRDKRNGAIEADELNKRATIKKCENRIVELKEMQRDLLRKTRKVTLTKEELDSKKIELSNVEKTIKTCNSELKEIRKKMPGEYHNTMNYFWPFLVLSIIVQTGVYFFGGSFTFYYLGLDDGTLTALAASAVVFALFHIFGGIYARKKTAAANKAMKEEKDALGAEEKRLRDTLAEFVMKKNTLTKEIEQAGA